MRRRSFVGGLAGTAAGLGLAGPAAAAPAPAPGWSAVPVPDARPGARLYGVAAAGPGDAWAVGVEGLGGSGEGTAVALRWDGAAWSRTDLGQLASAGALTAVTAADARTAWAVGANGLLLSWDGTAWRQAPYPGQGGAGTTVTDVAVAPDGRAWASGRHDGHAGLLYGDGRRWRWCAPLPDPAAPTPGHVHVTPGGEIWVYGDVIARWDGAWTVLPHTTGIRATVSGLLPVAHDDIWLTGFGYGVGGPPGKPPGVVLEHWDGAGWSPVKAPYSVGLLSSVGGDGRGRPGRITGWDFWDQKRSHYLRWDGAAWVSERGPAMPETALMTDLTRIPGTDGCWAVGTTSFYPGTTARMHIERFG
ncbi:hypothetical protein A6A06_28290 [Streptomyces sp. CB02923]|uniref:hypothetical protein n=1 Tax=Streptomyces sp. CB02923 TaxID=1718985 RepID=UPI00093FC314|nr:hypothetical protein [Streptomyces sp. CB02923]OKH98122.1 hypothetical protein A6A06_28290 [Streptomyces sp. CB02923]